MKKNNFIVLLLIALIAFSQGCYTMNQIGSYQESGIEITDSENATSVASFTKSKKVGHFLWGLVSPSDVGYEKMVADQIAAHNGARATRVRMKYQLTFVDGLIGLLTIGIYTPFTLTVTGDVVK